MKIDALAEKSIDLEYLFKEFVAVREVLIAVFDEDCHWKYKLQTESAEKLDKFKTDSKKLMGAASSRYVSSILGFKIEDKIKVKGFLQGDTKTFENLLFTLTQDKEKKYQKALDYLEKSIPMLKCAYSAYKDTQDLKVSLKSIVKLFPIDSIQNSECFKKEFLAWVERIDEYLDLTMFGFYSNSIMPNLLSLCDHLVKLKSSYAAVLSLGHYYQLLYRSIKHISSLSFKVKVLLGHAFFNNEESIINELIIFLKENKQSVLKELFFMVKNFIDSDHHSILITHLQQNQNLFLWSDLKMIIMFYAEDLSLKESVSAMLEVIEDFSNSKVIHSDSDEELPSTQELDGDDVDNNNSNSSKISCQEQLTVNNSEPQFYAAGTLNNHLSFSEPIDDEGFNKNHSEKSSYQEDSVINNFLFFASINALQDQFQTDPAGEANDNANKVEESITTTITTTTLTNASKNGEYPI